MKQIEITVSPTGETKVQTKGYSGGECQQASKFIEDALGLKVSDVKTAEFHTAHTTQQENQA